MSGIGNAEMSKAPRTAASLPPETTCHNCGTVAAEATCHVCKEDRPTLAAMKAISRKMAEQRIVKIVETVTTYPVSVEAPARLVECRYFNGFPCDCGGRGYCVCEAA